MSKIIKSKLGDICIQEKGAVISGPFGSNISSKYFKESGIPVIRGNNLSLSLDKFYDTGFVFISEEKANELKCDALRGDIIFTAAGTIGQVGIIPENSKYMRYVISNKQIRARIDITKVDLLFAYYWFSSPWIKKVLTNSNKGSTVPLLTLHEVKNLPICYPEDIDEQRNIAEMIDAITNKIENNKKINSEIEDMAKTIYDYWFLQFDFPDENGKPYKSSGGKMVWNDELKKEIPEGWEVRKIEDILAKIPATKKYKLDEYGKGSKYPIIDQSIKYICGYTDDESELLNLEDCIVFGDHTKYVKYVNFAFARGADGTKVINSSISNLPNYILYRQILDMDIVSQGYSRYFKFLKDKYVIVPQKNVSDGFKNCINDSLSKMKHIINENRELKSLRDFLLPLLMNGQVGFK